MRSMVSPTFMIRRLRSDGGGEYENGTLSEFCRSNAIKQEFTTPDTPQQNGVSERLNRTVVEMARTWMMQCNIPKTFWFHAVEYACEVLNRTPTITNNMKSPFEMAFKKKPTVSDLKVFGTVGYAKMSTQEYKKRKKHFTEKAERCRFLGFRVGNKQALGYKVWIPRTNTIVVRKKVKWLETTDKKQSDKICIDPFIYMDDENDDIEGTKEIPTKTNGKLPSKAVQELCNSMIGRTVRKTWYGMENIGFIRGWDIEEGTDEYIFY